MTLQVNVSLPPFCMPTELLRFVPRPQDIKQVFKNGDFERKIYTNIALDPHEKSNCAAVRTLQKQENVQLTRSMELRILRYISHFRGDVVKALEALIRSQDWRRTYFSPRISDEHIREKLNWGLAYFSGRDSGLRPFLVVRAAVAFKGHRSAEDITKLFAFCMEFALRYLFLPGKVETLNVILDLAHVGITQLRSETLAP